MKNALVFLLLGLTCGNAFAMAAVTKGGFPACLSEAYLDDAVAFAVAKDNASLQAYLDTQKCIIVKAGLRVTVTESPGLLGTTAGFVFEGIKLWTVREALDYGK